MEAVPMELTKEREAEGGRPAASPLPRTPRVEELSRAFYALVEELKLPGVDWALWHLSQLRDLAADPVVRVEVEAALNDDAHLRDEVTMLLDRLGEIAADARLAHQ